MAIYNLDNYLEKDGLGFPLNFRRGNPNPLDNSSVHATYGAATTYALTDPTAYVGQVLTVVYADEEKTVIDPTVYVIKDEAGTLEPVGVIPLGDDKTVVVGDDGTISLVGIDNIEDTTKKYQPVLIDGVLTWQELSATTVEGLAANIKAVESEIETIKTNAGTVADKVTALETTVGDAESGLVKTVADHTSTLSDISDAVSKNAEDIASVTSQANTNKDGIAALLETVGGHATRLTDAESAIINRFTKEETIAKIAEEIGKQAHFSAKIVTSTDEMTDTTTLYLVKNENAVGSDVYTEYMIIDGVPTIIGETSTDLSDYATLEALNNGLAEKANLADFNEVSASVEDILSRVSTAEGIIAGHTSSIEALTTAVGTKAEASDLENYVLKSTHESDINTINEVLDTRALASDLTELANTVGSNKTAAEEAISALQGADAALADRVKAIEDIEPEKNVIAAVSSEFEITNDTRTLSIKAINKDKVTGLTEELSKKVDAIDGYSLMSPDDAAKLKALVLGDSGKVEISGKVNASNVEELDTWIINNRDTLGGLFSSVNSNKLDGIESGAQVNVIEAIKLAGEAVSITDKTVNIPFATSSVAGVIKSATNTAEGNVAANAVYVDSTTGVGRVKTINVNSLVQDDGDILILNGGSASTHNN